MILKLMNLWKLFLIDTKGNFLYTYKGILAELEIIKETEDKRSYFFLCLPVLLINFRQYLKR